MSKIKLDGISLTREMVVAVARHGAEIYLCEEAHKAVKKASDIIAEKVGRGEVVYGVTTGFGSNADKLLSGSSQAGKLQRNLIITHAVGVGKPLKEDVVRATIVIRINTLLRGHSGIRDSTINTLVAMLNLNILPIIPEKGSVGASGDLAPLSHMALALIGEGNVTYKGEVVPASQAMKEAGLVPVVLTYKEGLALNNGTTLMLALLTLALDDLNRCLKLADIGAAMSTEAIAGRLDAFRSEVHALRPHPGQVATADNLRRLLQGSTLADIAYDQVPRADGGWLWNAEMDRVEGGKAVKPQDSYSVRCVPQVHGAARDAFNYAANVADIELNTVTDNPIVFPETGDVISAGNFHGMPLALAASFLKSVVPTLASISERRLNKMVDPATSDGLPAFLIKNEDNTDSGFMIVQYTAAALVNDLASRAMPASVFSVPTSNNTEDHVSMGANEARQLLEMMDDLYAVLALELYTSTQAVEVREKMLTGKYWSKSEWLTNVPEAHRARLQQHMASVHGHQFTPGKVALAVRKHVREHISFMDHDRGMTEDVVTIQNLVRSDALIQVAENCSGALLVQARP